MISDNSVENISKILKATRKFNRLGQTELAAILEVSQGTISKIESGVMHPELSLWFRFLRNFNISDPYCFSTGNLEFSEDTFNALAKNGSVLLPLFNFGKKENNVFTIRMIRPIFDFVVKGHLKEFEVFLKKFKISIEVFYILNHPITVDFVAALFSFLQEIKVNEKSLSLLDLNFDTSYGSHFDSFVKENSPESFFDLLSREKNTFVKYKLNSSTGFYIASLNKINLALVDTLSAKDLIVNYILTYPYHFLKSIKQCKITPPVVTEIKKNREWKISFAR